MLKKFSTVHFYKGFDAVVFITKYDKNIEVLKADIYNFKVVLKKRKHNK